MLKLKLYLYIVDAIPSSEKIIHNICAALDKGFNGQYSLKIIDLMHDPETALKDAIFVTPTLVKTAPKPVRRIIGDLSNVPEVLHCLGIESD